MKNRPCVRCHKETSPMVLERTVGEAEPLAVCVQGMPLLACEKGHRQFVDPEFPRRLVERLLDGDGPPLPAGKEKGLLFKHYLCSGCGAELAAQPDRRETFPLDVRLPELQPFRMELTAPVYRCKACARDQLHSLKEFRAQAPQALAHAFQAAEIPPA